MIIIRRIIIVTAKEFSTPCARLPLDARNNKKNAEEYVLTIWKPPQFFLFSYVIIGTNYLNKRLIPSNITLPGNSKNIGLN